MRTDPFDDIDSSRDDGDLVAGGCERQLEDEHGDDGPVALGGTSKTAALAAAEALRASTAAVPAGAVPQMTYSYPRTAWRGWLASWTWKRDADGWRVQIAGMKRPRP